MWEAAGLGGNGTFPLDHFSYNNSALVNVIFRNLEKTNFTGVTVSERQEDGNFMFVVAGAEVDENCEAKSVVVPNY